MHQTAGQEATPHTEQQHTVLVEFRFGRNVKGTPMDMVRWAEFQAIALDHLKAIAQDLPGRRSWTELHTGTGRWQDEETGAWESEESAVATLYVSAHDALDAGFIKLHASSVAADHASFLAGGFEQDAVAVVVAESSLAVAR